MKTRSKWIRYFNIILGIPNKKVRATGTPIISVSSSEPASRYIAAYRESDTEKNWQLKSDFDRTVPLIQNCEHNLR